MCWTNIYIWDSFLCFVCMDYELFWNLVGNHKGGLSVGKSIASGCKAADNVITYLESSHDKLLKWRITIEVRISLFWLIYDVNPLVLLLPYTGYIYIYLYDVKAIIFSWTALFVFVLWYATNFLLFYFDTVLIWYASFDTVLYWVTLLRMLILSFNSVGITII